MKPLVLVATVPWRSTVEQAVAAWRPYADVQIAYPPATVERGPALKYLQPIADHWDEHPIVVVCDDDMGYPASTLWALMDGLERHGRGVVLQGCRGGWVLGCEPPSLQRVHARVDPLRINVVSGGAALAFHRRDFELMVMQLQADEPRWGPDERICDDYTAGRACALAVLRVFALDLPLATILDSATHPMSLYRRDDGRERMLRCARRDPVRWWVNHAIPAPR